MEFLSRAFFGMVQRIVPAGKPQRQIEISRTDAYLNAIYNVLVWDNPKISFLALGLLHVLLWLIVHLELRFYGVIFLITLLLFLCDLFFEKCDVKAERSSSSDAMRQVGQLFKKAALHLHNLRNDNPSLFCITLCGIFLSLTVIARNISGFALAYLILLAIFTCPLIVSRIPPDYLTNFKDIIHTMGSNEGLLAESELLPFIANKDLGENDADLESSLTDKTADSINSLIYGMPSMPSYLDAEGGSLDGLEEEDLEFTIRPQQSSAVSYTPGEISSDSDSDHKSMSFESSHFNRDSSSEDENRFAKGLHFAEDTKDSKVQTSQTSGAQSDLGILGNITSLGTSLVSNILKTTVSNTSKRKNSDSDFEIIDTNEIDES
ncbi:hypothetical protein RN001_012818 [Aquatica leii]|uniref:Reticulon domain-containing protein n=1 Tax=Aquatica leii TaxID=1421715 RepID=A0AAN7P7Z1_9COLE|nr:hypothetical protein RN001_012818 [Aquatica leii]